MSLDEFIDAILDIRKTWGGDIEVFVGDDALISVGVALDDHDQASCVVLDVEEFEVEEIH